MRALAELLGAYGVKFFCRKMMNQIAAQVEELKVGKHTIVANEIGEKNLTASVIS